MTSHHNESQYVGLSLCIFQMIFGVIWAICDLLTKWVLSHPMWDSNRSELPKSVADEIEIEEAYQRQLNSSEDLITIKSKLEYLYHKQESP